MDATLSHPARSEINLHEPTPVRSAKFLHIPHARLSPAQMSIQFAAKPAQILGQHHVQLDLLEGAGRGDPRFKAAQNVERVLDILTTHLR